MPPLLSHSVRIDFSRNASVYDRRHGSVLELLDAQLMVRAAELLPRSRIADLGAGPGRAAITLSELGFDLYAVEPALGMIDAMRQKASNQPIRLVAADAGRLPFPDRRFDAVVVARLLYLVADWNL